MENNIPYKIPRVVPVKSVTNVIVQTVETRQSAEDSVSYHLTRLDY